MLPSSQTISIAFVNGMLSGVRSGGAPSADTTIEQCLAEAGIAPALLERPNGRVTVDQYVALFRILTDCLDDDFLGFLSRPMRRGTFALLIRSTLGSRNLDHALHRIARTLRLLQDDLRVVRPTERSLAGFGFVFGERAAVGGPFFSELLLRVFWRVIAWLHGGRFGPVRFDFPFAPPAHAAEYGKVFPGTVRFGADRAAVWFEACRLDVPMSRDEAAMQAFIAGAPRNVIVPQRNDRVVGDRVRGHLQRTRPVWPDLVDTAAALHVSTSTLQRRLSVEGTTFRTLRDQLRRDLAIVRLSTSAVPLGILAIELGFADSPAFQRAFKHWTGSAPGAYRSRSAAVDA